MAKPSRSLVGRRGLPPPVAVATAVAAAVAVALAAAVASVEVVVAPMAEAAVVAAALVAEKEARGAALVARPSSEQKGGKQDKSVVHLSIQHPKALPSKCRIEHSCHHCRLLG